MTKYFIRAILISLAAALTVAPFAAGCADKETPKTEQVFEESPEIQRQEREEAIATPDEEREEELTTPDEEREEAEEEIPETEETNGREEQEKESQTAQAQYILVKYEGVNIRTGAGTSYSAIGKAEEGTLLKCSGKKDDWYQTYYRGNVAYISAREEYTAIVSMDAASEQTEAVIEEGLKLLGTDYVYGAVRLHDGNGNFYKNFTATQFDCSSLMQYIFYYGAGELLNTTTRTQVLQGRTVEKADLQRGDLIFFTNASRVNNTGIERIGHVALYLGNNYILHTSSDYAKIERMTSARWNYYITARRML